jgi:hypothetical protein
MNSEKILMRYIFPIHHKAFGLHTGTIIRQRLPTSSDNLKLSGKPGYITTTKNINVYVRVFKIIISSGNMQVLSMLSGYMSTTRRQL